MEERHLSLGEVAEMLSKNERTIRRWIKSGKLRAYKPGRDYLIPESAISDLLDGSEVFPKDLAPPLPLEDTGGRGATEEGGTYTAFEAAGQVLASKWREELARWDEKIPDDAGLDAPEPDLDAPGELGFLQWLIDVDGTVDTFEAVARHGGGTPRQELADTLALMKDVRDAGSRKALKRYKRRKTEKQYQKIVAANTVGGILGAK